MLAGAAPRPARWASRPSSARVHNNYMTLPVLFVHDQQPLSDDLSRQPLNWLWLAGLGVSALTIRHFFNLRHKSKLKWELPAGALFVGVWRRSSPTTPSIAP